MGCSCSGDRTQDEPKDLIEPLFVDIVNKQIEENQLLLYTISDCEKSKQAKSIIRGQGLDFEYFDLDKLNDNKQILHTLQKMTNYRNVPYVFFKGKYRGGLVELEKILEEWEVLITE